MELAHYFIISTPSSWSYCSFKQSSEGRGGGCGGGCGGDGFGGVIMSSDCFSSFIFGFQTGSDTSFRTEDSSRGAGT